MPKKCNIHCKMKILIKLLIFRDFENYQNFQVKDSAKNGQVTERLEELAKPKKNFVETQVRKMDEHYWHGSLNRYSVDFRCIVLYLTV